MSRTIKHRLVALEQKLIPSARPFLEILISGGLTAGVTPIANFGGRQWEAAPNETFGAFRARARAAAKAEGFTEIVFGGLPDLYARQGSELAPCTVITSDDRDFQKGADTQNS